MKKFRLGDIANVVLSGIDKKTKEGESAIRLCNFTDVYYNWAITNNMYNDLMLASASDSDIETFSLKKGQVAITKDSETRDDIGVATYIADDFDDVVLGYHCALITPRTDVPEEEKIYGKYLNALLHTKYAQKYFSNNATGSGQRYTLSKEAIEDMPVYLPSYKEQVRIGDYLSDIDKKIEIINLINAELEAMSKQIYDYWFVQFDFPDKEGKPYKSSGGKMVWNETLKREIPEGWSDGVLKDIANITMGQSPDGSSYNEDGVGTIFYQGCTDFGVRFPKVRKYTTSPSRLAKKCDILMSVRAPVGTTNIANSDCCIGRGLAALNSSIGSITHLYQTIKDLKAKFDIINNGGTTFGAINKDELHSLIVTIPDETVLGKFEEIAEPIFEKQMELGFEIEELQSLRDLLLPLLINGQVIIKD